MSKRTLDDCKTKADFEKYAAAKGGIVREHGTHTTVAGPRGTTTLSGHSGEIDPKTRSKIRKWFALIGLAVLTIACSLPYLIGAMK